MASPNVRLVRDIYANFAQGDAPAVLDALDPEIEWTVSDGFPYAGTFIGGQAIVDNVFTPIPADWDGFRHELHSWVDCGREVLTIGTYHGTWRATGKAIEAPFVHLFELQDGRVTRFRQFVDGPATAAATGGFEHRSG